MSTDAVHALTVTATPPIETVPPVPTQWINGLALNRVGLRMEPFAEYRSTISPSLRNFCGMQSNATEKTPPRA